MTNRYKSGTSLIRTDKERQVEWFENFLGEFSDELFAALCKVPAKQLRELQDSITAKGNDIHDKYLPLVNRHARPGETLEQLIARVVKSRVK
jgi:hypothetical protein